MEQVTIPASDVHLYGKNAKIHSAEQLKMIAESIKNLGFDQPIVIDSSNTIIVGHGRFLAATKSLGFTEVRIGTPFAKKGEKFIPAIRRDDLSEAEAKVRRLNDNKLNESQWDIEFVLQELEELKLADDIDVSLTGFDDSFSDTFKPVEFDEEERLDTKKPTNTCPSCGHTW